VDREVPVAAVGQIATAFWRPDQDELLAPYTQLYLEAIPQLHVGGMIPAMGYTRHLLSPYAVDADYLDKARKAAAEAPPVVRTTLLERSDAIARMLRARTGTA
jgi:aminopeptidase N